MGAYCDQQKLCGSRSIGLAEMYKLGIIGTSNTHAHQYAAALNGWSLEVPPPISFPVNSDNIVPGMYLWMRSIVEELACGSGRVPHAKARVVALYGEDYRDAQRICEACQIPQLCGSPEDVINADIDAVLILTEDPDRHVQQALRALNNGLPSYIDKPLALCVSQVKSLASASKSNRVPFFSCSSLRFNEELLAEAATIEAHVGVLDDISVTSPGSLRLYSAHSLEILRMFLCSTPIDIRAIRSNRREIALISFENVSAILDHRLNLTVPYFEVSVSGSRGQRIIRLQRLGANSIPMVESIVRMLETGDAEVSLEEMTANVEIMERIQVCLNSC